MAPVVGFRVRVEVRITYKASVAPTQNNPIVHILQARGVVAYWVVVGGVSQT